MPINAFSDEREDQHLPKYKDPLSAKIIAAIAIFHLTVGIIVLMLGIYAALSIKTDYSASFLNMHISQRLLVFLPYIAIAVGSFIISAFFFVIYNIACDIHRTDYNLQVILRRDYINHKRIVKQMQYIDDTVTQQSNILIQKMNSNPPVSADQPRSRKESHAHDGAF